MTPEQIEYLEMDRCWTITAYLPEKTTKEGQARKVLLSLMEMFPGCKAIVVDTHPYASKPSVRVATQNEDIRKLMEAELESWLVSFLKEEEE